jgi:type IV secretory pathway VirB6-like protein
MANAAQKVGNITAAVAIGLFLLLILGPIVFIAIGCFYGACP